MRTFPAPESTAAAVSCTEHVVLSVCLIIFSFLLTRDTAARPHITQTVRSRVANPHTMIRDLAIRAQTSPVGPQPTFPPPRQGEELSFQTCSKLEQQVATSKTQCLHIVPTCSNLVPTSFQLGTKLGTAYISARVPCPRRRSDGGRVKGNVVDLIGDMLWWSSVGKTKCWHGSVVLRTWH